MTVIALKPTDDLRWSCGPGFITAQLGQLHLKATSDGAFTLQNAQLTLHVSANGQLTVNAEQISEFSREQHHIRAQQIHLN